MKKSFDTVRRCKLICIPLVLTFGIVSSSQAAAVGASTSMSSSVGASTSTSSSNAIVQSINNLSSIVQAAIATTIKTLYEVSNSQAAAEDTSISQSTAQTNIANKVSDDSSQNVSNIITLDLNSQPVVALKTGDMLDSTMPTYLNLFPAASGISASQQKNIITITNPSLSLNSILAYDAFDASQASVAEGFLQALAPTPKPAFAVLQPFVDQYNQFQYKTEKSSYLTLSPDTLKTIAVQTNSSDTKIKTLAQQLIVTLQSSDWTEYQKSLRDYVLQTSAGLDNLYTSIARRTKVTGLGKQAGYRPINANGMLGALQNDASPKQISDYAANRRIRSTAWYSEMAKASPATLMRENLYVNAELLSEIHGMRDDVERLTATVSTMVVQFASADSSGMKAAINHILGHR